MIVVDYGVLIHYTHDVNGLDPLAVSRSRALPLSAAVVPPLLFFGLVMLTRPPWPGIEPSSWGYGLLSFGFFIPLFVLCLPCSLGASWRYGAVVFASLASVLLCLHGRLSVRVVADLDAGMLSWDLVQGVVGVFFGAMAVPLGLLLMERFRHKHLYVHILAAAGAGAAGQLLWFGFLWVVEGTVGLHFWLLSRMLICVCVGAVAGTIAGGARLLRPAVAAPDWGGVSEILLGRLPGPLAFSVLVMLGMGAAGYARIAAERTDTHRFVTRRLDEYFLSLSNLRRAQRVGLAYTDLYGDLKRARSALVGATRFDARLPGLMQTVLEHMENMNAGDRNDNRFKTAVMQLNRRLLALGEPHFLEPHAVEDKGWPLRFVLRYSVAGISRYQIQGGGSVPVLRLRRLDDILVDTPYTGLSYLGIGTVLMDHIDDVALRAESLLFAPGATSPNKADGRFAVTNSLIKKDRKAALEQALAEQGHARHIALRALAQMGQKWSQVEDISGVRAKMSPPVLAVYDSLAEILAGQTEIHEARHAFDGTWNTTLAEFEELSAQSVGQDAASEIRAFLTEMVDGDLGAKFTLSTVCKTITDRNARANAYLFAAIVILEGLWGEKIRRPDVLEQQGEDGPRYSFARITPKTPGWLSYSRILGACADLSALPDPDLKQRAMDLFRALFKEDYLSIKRLGRGTDRSLFEADRDIFEKREP